MDMILDSISISALLICFGNLISLVKGSSITLKEASSDVVVFFYVRYWDPNYYRRRRAREDEGKGMNFVESVRGNLNLKKLLCFFLSCYY